MRIVVGGASGYLGSALVPALRADGHEVLRLVRRPGGAPDEVAWDPSSGTVDGAALAGVDGGVVLNGANVGTRRWTASYKETLLRSRVDPVRTLGTAFAALDPRPRVLVSGSAMGYYGDTGRTAVDESAPAGDTVLARVVAAWEAAADPAREAGVRVAHPRMAVVLGPGGGAGARLVTVARLGLGGRLGPGTQYWSVVSRRDAVRALQFLLSDAGLAGPVNVAAPEPPTSVEVVRALARELHRPAPWVVPAPALRLVLGEFADELLRSQAVDPGRLLGAGFTFEHPTLAAVVRHTLGRE